MECRYCGRGIKNDNHGSLKAHEKCCRSNPHWVSQRRGKGAGAPKGMIPWNKGKTAETNETVRRGAEKWKAKYERGEIKTGGFSHTAEARKKISEAAKAQGNGGYIKGSGRGKKGWYNGIFCDSSWELAYLIYCLEHGLTIARSEEKRTYVYEGRTKTYMPDFVVGGQVVEIKGWRTPEWEAKFSHNPDVKVLYKKEMRPILAYVEGKYGKNFTDLYGEVLESGLRERS